MTALVPAIATAISLAFGIHLLVRFARRRRWAEGIWAIALLMYATASGALTLGVMEPGWTPALFRTYWLFGAVLNVPYLALGEVYLLSRRPWVGHLGLAVVLAATAYATLVVRSAPVDPIISAAPPSLGPGEHGSGGAFYTGREVFGEGAPARTLAMIYSYTGTAVLVLGILWSALGMRGRPDLRHRLHGTLLIAGGALVVAGGSAFAAAGNATGFSLTLAVGVAVMYRGFLVATRRPAAPRA
ncbi:MAG TPA: hypothetical protein VM638_07145 [Actinomycetota bacterium]|nr:hypothetical protein [Actinomycetota bacterium]